MPPLKKKSPTHLFFPTFRDSCAFQTQSDVVMMTMPRKAARYTHTRTKKSFEKKTHTRVCATATRAHTHHHCHDSRPRSKSCLQRCSGQFRRVFLSARPPSSLSPLPPTALAHATTSPGPATPHPPSHTGRCVAAPPPPSSPQAKEASHTACIKRAVPMRPPPPLLCLSTAYAPSFLLPLPRQYRLLFYHCPTRR